MLQSASVEIRGRAMANSPKEDEWIHTVLREESMSMFRRMWFRTFFPADYEFREFGIRSGHSQTVVPVDKSVGQTHHIDVGVAEKFLRKGQ